MKKSEFWDALDQVFGPVLGRSLAQDLYLPALKSTAEEALNEGVKVDSVWEALVIETGQEDNARWIHRVPKKKRKKKDKKGKKK